MALPCSKADREYKKFVECPEDSGQPAVRTKICQDDAETVKVEFGKEGTYSNQYFEANAVASMATATVINYTVPVGKIFNLERVDYASDCIGIFEIEIDSNTESKQYTNYTKYTGEFEFSDYDLAAGSIIKLLIENRSKGTGSFNANMQGRLRDV